MTKDVGVHGNLFGGILLSWLDECGAIFAMQIAKSSKVVTLKLNEVLFKQPVKVNDVVLIYGDCIKIGNTSVTIKLTAQCRNMSDFKEHVVCETEMVFVNIDDHGKPTPIKKE
jgi:acyl-CoA thioesterase YciA